MRLECLYEKHGSHNHRHRQRERNFHSQVHPSRANETEAKMFSDYNCQVVLHPSLVAEFAVALVGNKQVHMH